MVVKFCPVCRTIMKIETEDETAYFSCPRGHYKEPVKSNTISKKIDREDRVTVIPEEVRTETVTKGKCPKCENNLAYTWIVQTRSGDEGPTVFYRCTRCGFTWRVYT
jgi:DNA-directed RNA polymerase subunit M